MYICNFFNASIYRVHLCNCTCHSPLSIYTFSPHSLVTRSILCWLLSVLINYLILLYGCWPGQLIHTSVAYLFHSIDCWCFSFARLFVVFSSFVRNTNLIFNCLFYFQYHKLDFIDCEFPVQREMQSLYSIPFWRIIMLIKMQTFYLNNHKGCANANIWYNHIYECKQLISISWNSWFCTTKNIPSFAQSGVAKK